MRIEAGIPTIEEYDVLTKSDAFARMQAFSDDFLQSNKTFLVEYMKKWVSDPLQQFNRRWEYSFAFERIGEYVQQSEKGAVKILDAGSGVTFFPFYIAACFSESLVSCCDADSSLEGTFSNINRRSESQVEFRTEDIRRLSYSDRSFDVVYCISVLEHTRDFESIIKEFKRVLVRGGMLIVTFDISIDGTADIRPGLAERLLQALTEHFAEKDTALSAPLTEVVKSPEILTSRYMKRVDPDSLPWRHPLLSSLKSALRFRIPRGMIRNLTCFGQAFWND